MSVPKPVFARIEIEAEEDGQASSKAAKGGKKKARSKGLVEA
jgi:methionyl-tRNA synthetase